MARRHLAIFLKGVAEKVLKGEKSVEIRLSQNRIAPYLEVQKDDEIYLKNSGGRIIGKITVDNCLYYEHLSPAIIQDLRKTYFNKAAMNKEFWQKKSKAHFATIIFLKNPTKFLTPVAFKKHDRRPWVVMEGK